MVSGIWCTTPVSLTGTLFPGVPGSQVPPQILPRTRSNRAEYHEPCTGLASPSTYWPSLPIPTMINGLYRIGANPEVSELEKFHARDRQWLIASAEYTPYSHL